MDGYTGERSKNFKPLLESSIDLSDIADIVKKVGCFWSPPSNFDHQVLWVTPMKNWAEAIGNARFILEYCIDDNFRDDVRTSEKMPCVAEFEVDEEAAFIYLEGRLTRYQGKKSAEMIAQKAAHYQLLKPNKKHLQKVMAAWDDQKARDIPGFHQFVQEIKKVVRNSRIDSWLDMNLSSNLVGRELVKYFLDYYQAESIFNRRDIKETLLQSFLPTIDTTNIVYATRVYN